MNHAELSRDLALAIGWPEAQVKLRHDIPMCRVLIHAENGMNCFRPFDYRDPTVWGPVLEWLRTKHKCEMWSGARTGNAWIVQNRGFHNHTVGNAPTLAEAVARAAIAVGAKR